MQIKRNYVLIRDFKDKNDIVLNTMNKLYKNSLEYYFNNINNNEILSSDLSNKLKFIVEKLMDIESYLYYYKDTFKFEYILSALEKVSTIAIINENSLRLSARESDIVFVKQNMGYSRNLEEPDRTTLYLIREIELLINEFWLSNIRDNFDLDNKREIYDGFEVISDVLAQERAEQYIYNKLGKERPEKEYMHDYTFCKTNLDSYGQYETSVMWFGASLNGIGNLKEPEEVICSFSIKAIDNKFACNIIDEYTSKNNINELWLILEYIGNLRNYNKFESNLTIVSELLIPLRDYSKPKQKINN